MATSPIMAALDLQHAPVAIAFVQEIPAGIPRVSTQQPAGCAYWKLAAAGQVFCATPEDHFGCPIGAYVQGLSLPGDALRQLSDVLGMMHGLEYLKPEEVSQIPRLGRSWAAVVYAPLDQAPFPPDVVIFLGRARQLMLLVEAAQWVGLPVLPLSGRPACGMIPAVVQSGGVITNLGCIGNRVYTQMGDDEFYLALPGAYVAEVEQALPRICHANRELEHYHCGRKELQLAGEPQK
uniref:DUF169 domain-containing protein n=1 Tax=Schlesneria paludicola TaxID=360056 RepID=A0A7C4LN61_9PLAN